RWVTDVSHNGAISRYLAIFTVTSVVLGWIAYSSSGLSAPTRGLLPVPPVVAVGWIMLIVATVSVVTMHHHRFRALVLIGVIGLSISAGFAYLSAPDLALTQISVETVTIMLLLLALNFMPKVTPKESPSGLKLRDGVIALGAGGGVAALAYAFLMRDIETISDYHLANSYEGGGGTNVVNVILVDFRGYNTFGEIIVLGIAGLVIYAMMHALLDGPAGRQLKNTDYSLDLSRDRHPLMMVVVTRVLMPIAIVVGLFIFLRGYNEPGGGFVAGLVIAIALLMQYMASGFAWTQERKRIEYHTMIGLGVVIAGLTGVGAWLVDRPFLTSGYTYVHLPPIEEFELATAMVFDLGVFLTVLGAVMLMLYSLSRIASFAGGTLNVDPMDYEPGGNARDEAER
ncbi:MAG: hydrogen gas-evolving membrane-bound hydrogenase subunit E, partial [Anderseniella sp.]|nr:hydrogen gas-evolving membrane-bound hydrogenase subunit E [Anderseniella sp.]